MALKFRLQRVLDLRYSQEEQAKKELARRQQNYQEAVRLVNLLLEEEGLLWELIRGQQAKNVNLGQLQQLSDFNACLGERIQEQETKKMEYSNLLEEQRVAVKACWQKRRVLEILQNKALTKQKEVIENREQRMLDELVLFRFGSGVS